MLPGRARAAARGRRAGGLRASSGCSPPTPTGTTCSGGYAFPEAPLGVRASRPPRGCARARARRSASCASSTTSTTSSARRRCAAGRRRRCPCPGAASVGERELELHPADGHTADGMAIWIAVGAACSSSATTCRRSRSRCCRRRGSRERLPRDAGPAASRWSSRPSTSCRATASPLDATRAAAILREDRAYLEALRERGAEAPLPLARRTARSAGSTRRTRRGCERPPSRRPRARPRGAGGGDASGWRRTRRRWARWRPRPRWPRARASRSRRRASGAKAALARFTDVLMPLTTAIDHPRYFAFIPTAPTPASALIDVLTAYASTRARGWRARARSTPRTRRCAGSPTSPASRRGRAAASCQGGTTATCRRWSPRASARAAAAPGDARRVQRRGALVGARVLRHHGRRGRSWCPARRLDRAALRAALARRRDAVFAVVATAGTTNLGLLDDLAGIAAACRRGGRVAARRRRLRRGRAVRAERARGASPASSRPTR